MLLRRVNTFHTKVNMLNKRLKGQNTVMKSAIKMLFVEWKKAPLTRWKSYPWDDTNK